MPSIGEIIYHYRKSNKLSQKELIAKLKEHHISVIQQTVSAWENDASDPSASTFMQICRVLGITHIYAEYWGSNPDDPLSELNPDGKAKAYEYIDLLLGNANYRKTPAQILPIKRTLRLYDTPVSAGTGNILEESNYSVLEVGPEVPENADYGVRITGDSMEPQFIHGQVVWVHNQDTIEDGQIGIFLYDDMVYIKKYHQNPTGPQLISLNKKYAPICMEASVTFKVLGKIV